jgi:hypothetical protein
MTSQRFDALAARLLERTREGEVEPPPRDDRARAIAAVEKAIRRKARRRILIRSALAAAAVVALGASVARLARHDAGLTAHVERTAAPVNVTVVGHPRGGGATVVETGTPTPLTEGRSLASGSRIVAQPDGDVVLALSTGTRLTVEQNGDLAIVDRGPDELFALRVGAVRADVAKLHSGQRFVIRTPDAEVEVRGTSFRVATADADPACENGTVTRVEVYEGIVSVRHAGREARVGAGQSWPSDCASSSAPSQGTPKPRASAVVSRRSPATLATSGASAHEAEESLASDLREQNDAFGRALAAKRRGSTREAIDAFDAFVARYPTSSLVENALVQRMRLLRETEPKRAAAAARQYLARYPNGFARSEAEARLRRAP